MPDGAVGNIKESGQRILAWVKKRPALAAGIVLGVAGLAYLASRQRGAGQAGEPLASEIGGDFSGQVGGTDTPQPPPPQQPGGVILTPPPTPQTVFVPLSDFTSALTEPLAEEEFTGYRGIDVFGPEGRPRIGQTDQSAASTDLSLAAGSYEAPTIVNGRYTVSPEQSAAYRQAFPSGRIFGPARQIGVATARIGVFGPSVAPAAPTRTTFYGPRRPAPTTLSLTGYKAPVVRKPVVLRPSTSLYVRRE